ncbi:hypothetical protein ACXXDK_08545 [Deinococcus sp. PESE-38]
MLKKILTLGLLCSAPALAQSVRLPDVDCSRTPKMPAATFAEAPTLAARWARAGRF